MADDATCTYYQGCAEPAKSCGYCTTHCLCGVSDSTPATAATVKRRSEAETWRWTLDSLSAERPEPVPAITRAVIFGPQRDTAGEKAQDIIDALHAAGWKLVRNDA